MSDPYRDSEHREGVEAPRDRGIVGDVIAQFADPHAFYRELVQNSIDAGSPDIEIELAYDDSAQRIRVAVRDRGEGMTREIIEKQLLVLFRSSKEKDKTKIGKFGVGFASVLSANPEVVAVNTSRDGKKLTLHLYRDLTYELFDAGRATHAGTTVELEILLARDAVDQFERASEAALRRWCRHASVPIQFAVRRGDAKREVRIDGPLAIDSAHVEVRKLFDNGELTVVAGLPVKGEPYLGFFNHGLMLHETIGHLPDFPKVQIKIQDSRLGHTISRDDVRRDDHYRHAVASARSVVQQDLATAASERMRELAATGKGTEYCDLLKALVASELDPKRWHFPLVDALGEQQTIDSALPSGVLRAPAKPGLAIADDELPKRAWGSVDSTPLTQSLAAAGIAVLHMTQRAPLQAALERTGRVLVNVDSELTAVTVLESSFSDTALIAVVAELLDHAHRAPAGVVLASLAGAREDLLAVALSSADTRVVDREDAVKNPFAVFGRRTIALSEKHPHVKAARAADDPTLAAAHLVRAVLLQYGLLDEDRSRKLLDLALARIGVGA